MTVTPIISLWQFSIYNSLAECYRFDFAQLSIAPETDTGFESARQAVVADSRLLPRYNSESSTERACSFEAVRR